MSDNTKKVKITIWDISFVWELKSKDTWNFINCAFRQISRNRFQLEKLDWIDSASDFWLLLWNIVVKRENLEKLHEEWNLKINEKVISEIKWRDIIVNDKEFEEKIKKYKFEIWTTKLINFSLT